MFRTLAAPIAGGTNVQLLEKIISDQRNLLKEVFNTTDLTDIPQVWTLCRSCLDGTSFHTLTHTVHGS